MRSKRSASIARWARIGGVAIAAAFALYLLVANVILGTGLLRGWLNGDETKLRVQYTSAWSAYPGHVAVRGLTLRYQDKNIQMLLAMESAKIRLSLWGLTERTLRVSRLSAEGVSFRMRHKVETLEGNEGRVAAFPPIEGFADPPVEPKAPEPETPDDPSKLWAFEIGNITASVREVWTMEVRYRGDATVHGGFHLRPKREVWVSPSVMVTHGGALSLGDRDLIQGGEGRVEAVMGPFDVRIPQGIEVLRYLTASVKQTGHVPSLTAVSATYLAGTSMALERGAGPIEIDVRVARGVFQPGSRVTYGSDDVALVTSTLTTASDLTIAARVEGPPERPVIAGEATMNKAAVSPTPQAAGKSAEASPASAMDVRGARASIALDTADLVGPAAVAHAAAAFTSARVSDLRAWQPIAPDNTSFDGGAATFAGRADYDGGSLQGRLDAILERTRMTFGTFKVASSGKVWTNVVSKDVTKGITFPGASADLDGIALQLERGRAEGLWLRARFAEASVTTSGPLAADADIAVESGPGDRTVQLFTRMARLPDVAADAAAGSQLAALLHLRVRTNDTSLAVLRAKNGALEGRGRVRKTQGPVTGAFLVSVGPLTTGLELSNGGISVSPFAGGGWLETRLREK